MPDYSNLSDEELTKLYNNATSTAAPAAPAGSSIPAGAIAKLKASPGLRDAFEQKYGAGSAASILGQ